MQGKGKKTTRRQRENKADMTNNNADQFVFLPFENVEV